MIKQIYLEGPFGDETSNFKIAMTTPLTVKNFITEIMTIYPKEWGSIYINSYLSNSNKIINYRYGEYTIINQELYEQIKNKIVTTANGHGGWSLMDYELIMEG